MSSKSKAAEHTTQYKGLVRLPGTDEAVEVNLVLDLLQPAVSVNLSGAAGAPSQWKGKSISVRRLIKYDEVHFVTDGLPEETVILQWKTNFSKADPSVAGVVIARPNDRRISGEVGFTLSRSG